MHRFNLIIIFLILIIISTLGAQEMITDRPDYTESAVVVPAKSSTAMGLAIFVFTLDFFIDCF